MDMQLRINGHLCPVEVGGERALVSVLRDELGLRGTKIGCAAGECGACTVLLDGQPVCACLVPVGRCAGRDIRTIEGVEADSGGLHPIQRALVEQGAFQCGFCTPGIVMTLMALAERKTVPSEAELKLALQGHVCRCSGYVKLIEAALCALESIAGAGASA